MILPCGHEFGINIGFDLSVAGRISHTSGPALIHVKQPEWNRKMINSRIEYINQKWFRLEDPSPGKIFIVELRFDMIHNIAKANLNSMIGFYSHERFKNGKDYYLYFIVDPGLKSQLMRKYDQVNWGYKCSIVVRLPVKKDEIKDRYFAPKILREYGKYEKIRKVSILSDLDKI